MKAYRPTIFLALFILIFLRGGAQNYVPLPPAYDGSMMPIDFTSFTPAACQPDSLQPVYSAYVARHGARYLSGEAKLKPVLDALQSGRNAGTLSETGEDFFSLVERIRAANEGNWGDLSPEGYREERLLGEALYKILPPLSRRGVSVKAVSSFMPRCVMTMYLLTNSLLRCNDAMTVATDEGHQYDSIICCFMADKEFARYRKEGNWKPVYEDFVRKHVSAEPGRRLFTRTDLTADQLRKLTLDMYEVLKANRAAGLPAPTTQWMSREEYYNCWRASNLQHYLRNSITNLSNLAATATLPLLNEIIDKIDKAAAQQTPQPAVDAWFGHAETLLPLLAVMRLPGCYEVTDDYDTLEYTWKIEQITPLGAYLDIILSNAPSGEKYVSIRLNGRCIRPIPGKPDYVKWSDLKSYWTDALTTFNITPETAD